MSVSERSRVRRGMILTRGRITGERFNTLSPVESGILACWMWNSRLRIAVAAGRVGEAAEAIGQLVRALPRALKYRDRYPTWRQNDEAQLMERVYRETLTGFCLMRGQLADLIPGVREGRVTYRNAAWLASVLIQVHPFYRDPEYMADLRRRIAAGEN